MSSDRLRERIQGEKKQNQTNENIHSVPCTFVAVHSGEWDNSSRMKSGSVRRRVNRSVFSISIAFLAEKEDARVKEKKMTARDTNDFARVFRLCSFSTSWLMILSHNSVSSHIMKPREQSKEMKFFFVQRREDLPWRMRLNMTWRSPPPRLISFYLSRKKTFLNRIPSIQFMEVKRFSRWRSIKCLENRT